MTEQKRKLIQPDNFERYDSGILREIACNIEEELIAAGATENDYTVLDCFKMATQVWVASGLERFTDNFDMITQSKALIDDVGRLIEEVKKHVPHEFEDDEEDDRLDISDAEKPTIEPAFHMTGYQ